MKSLKKTIVKITGTAFAAALFGVLIFSNTANPAFADFATTTILTGSGTFTVPAGVSSLDVSVIAGGGGGGGGAFTFAGGGGGAGSAVLDSMATVTPGQVISYAAGLGGQGGAGGSFSTAAGTGQNGGSTSFGTIVSAQGGNGGMGGIYGNTGSGVGGLAGGIGAQNGTNGDDFVGTRVKGGNGGNDLLGTGGNGGHGNSTSYVLATTGVLGGGGGGASGWQFNPNGTADAGAKGGDGVIVLNYTVDTTAPVITILGQNPITIALGSTYVDAGATAFDNIDGDLTAKIITTNPVNTAATGTYMVTYSVTDAGGNTATATRTVNVVDASSTDITPPSAPLIAATTAATGTISASEGISWFNATDTQSGVAYYLYIWDNSAATVLSATTPGVSTTTSTSTSIAAFGTWWFHVAAVDNAGNVSTTTTYGPFVLSDSNVLYVNSTIGGTTYILYSPTSTEAVTASTTGTTTIANSTVSDWWDINNSNLDTTSITDAILDGADATNSTIINAEIHDCQVVNSLVKNYYVADCYIAFSVVDPAPATLYIFIHSTSTNSEIYASNITDSVIDHSYVATSTIASSNISFSTTTDSTIATSTVSGGSVIASSTLEVDTVDSSTISSSTVSTSTVTGSSVSDSDVENSALLDSTTTDSSVASSSLTNTSAASSSMTNSTLTDSTLVNSTTTDSTIASSTLTDVVAASSTISGSTIADATITDATIIDDTIYTGSITYNGTTTVISTSTPLADLIEYAPVAAFSVSAVNLNVSITDDSVDQNSGTPFLDSWTYAWDFGDGSTTTVSATSTGNNISHTYATSGTYVIALTLTDAYGKSSTATDSISVSFVPDTIPPVITILGNNPASVVLGDVYVDAGATSSDNVDGDITADIASSSDVDTSILGSYSVVYSVSDAAGNFSSATRTVNVIAAPDTIPPVITILGNNPDNIIQNSSYVDAGATAFDNVDGTTSVSATGTVDTSATGTYFIVYSSTDSSGNTATATRTVNVLAAAGDVIPPVITIIGGTPTTTYLGSTYIDPGATAFDNVDGTTSVATILNTVDTSATGTYEVVYSATDTAGNNATATRQVNVIAAPADIIPPVITIIGGTPTTTLLNSVWTDPGATALDDVDGDVSASIVASGTVDTTATGTYFIDYTAHDAAGNYATATRQVNVVEASTSDNIPPVITITGGTPITVLQNSTYVDQGATALDNVDGDITADIASSSDVDTSILGSYSVVYSVSDAAGNFSSATRTVNVIAAPDTIPPVITLNGGSPMTLPLGATYTEPGATATDNVDGTDPVVISGDTVNTSATGTYIVIYTATDNAGNVASATRTVNVIDADITPPVITILGANPMTIVKGLPFTDPGALAIDGVDGSTTVTVISNNVNTAATGTYFVVYSSTDLAGNTATSSREVDVVPDTTAPVITLNGSNPDSVVLGGVYTDPGATALDNVDGDLTANIFATGTVDTSATGTYFIDYSVTDSSGNVGTSSREVDVIAASSSAKQILSFDFDALAPAVTGVINQASGTISLLVPFGTDLTNLVPTITLSANASVSPVSGAVEDFTNPVIYTVTAQDLSTTTYTVSVSVSTSSTSTPDTIPPVITITGSNPATVTQGSTYSDQGATAFDNVDGATAVSVVSNNVDTATLGTYFVVYSSTDLAGNTGMATRTVDVIAAPSAPSGPTGGGGPLWVDTTVYPTNNSGAAQNPPANNPAAPAPVVETPVVNPVAPAPVVSENPTAPAGGEAAPAAPETPVSVSENSGNESAETVVSVGSTSAATSASSSVANAKTGFLAAVFAGFSENRTPIILVLGALLVLAGGYLLFRSYRAKEEVIEEN